MLYLIFAKFWLHALSSCLDNAFVLNAWHKFGEMEYLACFGKDHEQMIFHVVSFFLRKDLDMVLSWFDEKNNGFYARDLRQKTIASGSDISLGVHLSWNPS